VAVDLPATFSCVGCIRGTASELSELVQLVDLLHFSLNSLSLSEVVQSKEVKGRVRVGLSTYILFYMMCTCLAFRHICLIGIEESSSVISLYSLNQSLLPFGIRAAGIVEIARVGW